ncbi:MAG: helix-turn-helix domain-containing protein [Eubacterium sp.]|nr:helix-turn-helix domain-containing protein [Eubacterium sp.]
MNAGKGNPMEDKTIYYISEAAKKVQVENHVLRYWEDELQLPIKRNEMGHRYYTEQDVKQLQEIKMLKEQGLQLKAIRTVLFKMPALSADEKKDQPGAEENTKPEKCVSSEDNTDIITPKSNAKVAYREESPHAVQSETENQTERRRDKLMDMVKERVEQKLEDPAVNKAHRYMVTLSGDAGGDVPQKQDYADEEKSQKAARLQYLLQHMITEAVRSANRELCTEVKESILKELDYQFRMQEERDEERRKIEEEHYRKIDEMIRERHKPKEKLGKGRKKL